MVEALRCFCDGKHPEFPLDSEWDGNELSKLRIDTNLSVGRNTTRQMWNWRYKNYAGVLEPRLVECTPVPRQVTARNEHTMEPQPEIQPMEREIKGEEDAVRMIEDCG